MRRSFCGNLKRNLMRKKEKLIIGKVWSTDGYPTQIFDEENNHIADVEVRSWGRLQYMEEGDKLHAQLSNFIQDAINEKMSKMNARHIRNYVREERTAVALLKDLWNHPELRTDPEIVKQVSELIGD